jgi:chemotaxis protein MotB
MAMKNTKQSPNHNKDDRPKIIIRKSKEHHGGHHGGAWKVAYADFVTAMMALFIVLWVLGAADKKYKAGIAHYFREPGVFSGSSGVIPDGGQEKLGAGIIAAPSLEVLETRIKERLSGSNEVVGVVDQVPIRLMEDGLLIEVIDKEKHAFFDLSSAAVKPIMRKVLAIVVEQVKESPYELVISGHTDARPYQDETEYTNWDLSTQRALNTRRVLQQLGIAPQRVGKVAGYADRQLRVPTDPLSSENRRITILVRKPVQNSVR